MNSNAPAFGSSTHSSASPMPFAQASSSMSQQPPSFGASSAPPPTQALFGGRTPRDILVAFYQRYNAAKVAEVDKVLIKYQGKEDLMFRNLAKKYTLDPSVFGLQSITAPVPTFGSPGVQPPNIQSNSQGFGQPSMLGGTSSFTASSAAPTPFGGGGGSFGSPSTLGQGTPSGFGSAPTPAAAFGSNSSGFGASTFGSLATSSSPSPFGAASGGFGSGAPSFGTTGSSQFGASTPFGAPRR